ncbi:MAG: acyl-ACP desaturase [Chloroflexota bacterium]|nr:acyl-ACP desaturase [Chloroflexota bacterium]
MSERESTIGHPTVVQGPWTREARQKAVDDECLEAFIEYFGRAMESRRWSPWHDFPFEEMREYGHKLSDETVDLIEGFLGIEEYVGDYVEEGLEMFRNNRTRRNLQLQWGAEEMKHGVAWEQVLLHSGVRTEGQLKAYIDKVAENHWSTKNHKGLDRPLGVSVYAMMQERATFYNYEQVRLRIREEYGLPERLTEEERARGKEVGVAEAFRVVSIDEIAHHAIFLQLVQIHLRYFPEETLDTMQEVFDGFNMPSLRLIPNRRAFIRAVARTNLHTAEKHLTKIHNPVLRAVGLENNEALERAVQEAKQLPEGLGPEHVVLGKNGEFVISVHPN